MIQFIKIIDVDSTAINQQFFNSFNVFNRSIPDNSFIINTTLKRNIHLHIGYYFRIAAKPVNTFTESRQIVGLIRIGNIKIAIIFLKG